MSQTDKGEALKFLNRVWAYGPLGLDERKEKRTHPSKGFTTPGK